MKKIIIILSTLIIIIAIIGFVIIKDKNTAPKTEEQKQTQTPKEVETKEEQEGYPTIKFVDGQLFIMKQDGLIYCRLGEDKDGNIIEVETLNEECLITEETCKILLEDGTTLLEENPKFLEQCK